MEEKKKLYEAPQVEVAEVDAASIICTSGSGEPKTQSKTEALQYETYEWN